MVQNLEHLAYGPEEQLPVFLIIGCGGVDDEQEVGASFVTIVAVLLRLARGPLRRCP